MYSASPVYFPDMPQPNTFLPALSTPLSLSTPLCTPTAEEVSVWYGGRYCWRWVEHAVCGGWQILRSVPVMVSGFHKDIILQADASERGYLVLWYFNLFPACYNEYYSS